MIKREEIKRKVDDLMNQYDKEEIDGDTYMQKMMDLNRSVREENSKKS